MTLPFSYPALRAPHLRTVVAACSLLLLATACQSTNRYQNSSVVDYLYADSHREVSAEIPSLHLPLRVGVAFTPSGYDPSALPEKTKLELLRDVSERFKALDFVKAIEIIPSAYLKPRGSFENLDQLKRMFNIDVIALVSYDQTSFTDESIASLAYWTIVGAYLVPAEKNTTHTMLDAVVFDIDSRKMLFRAPGISSVKGRSTLINLEEKTRENSLEGFTLASTDLATNLALQLELFRERIKEAPDEVRLTKAKGYQGSGSTGPFLLAVIVLLGWRLLRR